MVVKNYTFKTKKWRLPAKSAVLYLSAFLIPVIVMLLILKSGGFYPFGEKTLFIMDMKGQYLEFFASLRNIIHGDDSLFFSWSRSMGGNYLGLFAYYVASPLSFITIFFPLKKLTSAIVLLTVLKIGLAGLSFSAYGAYLWKRENKSEQRIGIVLPFAVSYALISYSMVYSMCLMWLDGVILLPAILLGAEKLLDGKKGLHYMLTLAALFICNYYTGYMVGIFTAIYMIYRVLCRVTKDNVREYLIKTLRFAGTTLLAVGLSAPLMLPVVKDLMQGKLASENYMPDTKTNFVFADLLKKLTNGVYDSITNSGLPSIYCGYVVLLFAVLFFFLRKISVREKIGSVLVLALMACSFYYTKWDIAWHGFQYPTWFPYRYAFVCSFFLIYMAMRSICAMGALELFSEKETVKKNVSGETGIEKKTARKKEDEERVVEKDIIKTDRIGIAVAVVMTLIVAADMGTNGKAMFDGLEKEFGYCPVADYEGFLDKTQPLVAQIQEEDNGFYRINQGYEFSKNDAMLLGYNGMTHYSSTFNAAVNSLTPKLGIAQTHIWNSGYGTNPLLDSLFSVKYILDDGMVPADYVNIGGSQGGASVYRNEMSLPIAYSATSSNLSPDLNSADVFVNQNNLLNAIAGTEQSYFTEFAYTYAQYEDSWTYSFMADSTNPVYLYMKSDRHGWADVYVNDNWVGNYFSSETSCNLYLGNFQPGQHIVVKVVPSGEIAVNYAMIGQLHMDLLKDTMDTLSENGMEISLHKDGKLSGEIMVEKGQKIITSIPYDSGWTVKIDGEKVEPIRFADTFLAIEAEEGEHEITFSYVSPGFGMGMFLFVIAVILSVLYYVPVNVLYRKKR